MRHAPGRTTGIGEVIDTPALASLLSAAAGSAK
jgi:hypothetical protein